MKGFFSASVMITKAPTARFPKCEACGLFKLCQSPKIEVAGEGKKKILIVGEVPGNEEDKKGKFFVGEEGDILRKTFRQFGVSLDQDCWRTKAIICHPRNGRKPTKKELEFCRPNLSNVIREKQPEIIIPLGEYAVKQLLAVVWKEALVDSINQWAGFQIPCQKPNAWICPTYDPRFLAYFNKKENPLPERFFKQHIQKAVAKKGRPWDRLPHYEERVRVILDDKEAAKAVRQIIAEGKRCSFDTESTSLKPYVKGSKLVCVGISNGNKTIAFPWHGRAVDAGREFFEANLDKVAHNLKHDDQWARANGVKRVKRFRRCTMNTAHILDNRPAITSLKFQAFVNFGQDSYEEKVKKFMKGTKGSKLNQILEEVDIKQLLLYCGIDTLLTHMLDQKQERVLTKGDKVKG